MIDLNIHKIEKLILLLIYNETKRLIRARYSHALFIYSNMNQIHKINDDCPTDP